MWQLVLAPVTACLGAAGGIYIARSITDETEWYKNWFLGVGTLLALAAGVTFTNGVLPTRALGATLGLILAGLIAYGLATKKPLVTTISAGLLLGSQSALTWELGFLTLLPVAGYMVSTKQNLRYFALTPLIVLLVHLLL